MLKTLCHSFLHFVSDYITSFASSSQADSSLTETAITMDTEQDAKPKKAPIKIEQKSPSRCAALHSPQDHDQLLISREKLTAMVDQSSFVRTMISEMRITTRKTASNSARLTRSLNEMVARNFDMTAMLAQAKTQAADARMKTTALVSATKEELDFLRATWLSFHGSFSAQLATVKQYVELVKNTSQAQKALPATEQADQAEDKVVECCQEELQALMTQLSQIPSGDYIGNEGVKQARWQYHRSDMARWYKRSSKVRTLLCSAKAPPMGHETDHLDGKALCL